MPAASAAALTLLAMVRADMAKILSSGGAPDALQAGGGSGREVGHVAARFLVGFGARDVQPCGAIGFCGQVLPLKGCGFAAAEQAIAAGVAQGSRGARWRRPTPRRRQGAAYRRRSWRGLGRPAARPRCVRLPRGPHAWLRQGQWQGAWGGALGVRGRLFPARLWPLNSFR